MMMMTMTERGSQKQKNINIKDLQTEQYLHHEGKFFTDKKRNTTFNFSELCNTSSKKTLNPFITSVQQQQMEQQLQKNRKKEFVLPLRLNTRSNSEQMTLPLPVINRQTPKTMSQQEDQTSLFLKRSHMPLVASNPNTHRFALNNQNNFITEEGKASQLKLESQSQTSSAWFAATVTLDQTHHDHFSKVPSKNSPSKPLRDHTIKNFRTTGQKMKQNALYKNLSESLSDFKRVDNPKITENNLSVQQNLKSNEGIDIPFGRYMHESSSIQSLGNQQQCQQHTSYFDTRGNESTMMERQIIPSTNKDATIPSTNQDAIIPSINYDASQKRSSSIQLSHEKILDEQKFPGQKEFQMHLRFLERRRCLERTENKASSNLRVKEHMHKLNNILDQFKGTEGVISVKEKLRKVAQNVIRVQRFSTLSKPITDKLVAKDQQVHRQYIRDLEKYNSSLSQNHSIFIKEFFYKIQEFLEMVSSNKRASQMIQAVRGFTPIIKKILFIEEEIRKDFSLELLEKQIQTVMQFQQMKGEFPQAKQKFITRRMGVKFDLSADSVKDLQFFYKNLCEFIQDKNFQHKVSMQSQFQRDYDEIQNILLKYNNESNQDKQQLKHKCFKELMVCYTDTIPFFIHKNMSLQNIKYWEKVYGKFDMISQFVREKDTQITHLCKIYQNI